ncbi:Scr1 family TA system antitoxin-like transcriptional regulator [Streptomyces sp. NPDC056230]|uniref:Scr1 family TA system antitoxin-like transcriptional regulator n=1 Tax=Streptomyces sp. NPDC056230 TaxID=3345754 RepID=UPI0035DC13D8
MSEVAAPNPAPATRAPIVIFVPGEYPAGADPGREWALSALHEWLYRPGKRLYVLRWESVLLNLICPPRALAAQLDRLADAIGMDTVDLGVVPLHASVKVPPANGFWSVEARLVITEDWHAELWLDDADPIATYQRVWQSPSESVLLGAGAQHVVTQARRSVDAR